MIKRWTRAGKVTWWVKMFAIQTLWSEFVCSLDSTVEEEKQLPQVVL